MIAGAVALAALPASAEKLTATYLYNLVGDSGALKVDWVPLSWDAKHQELYLVDRTAGLVRVFSDTGMNLFSFGEDRKFGNPVAAVPLPSGDVMVLAALAQEWTLARYSYRGEPLEKLSLADVPPSATKGFRPDALASSGGELFLADRNGMRVVVLDTAGKFRRIHELSEVVGRDESDTVSMRGFTVDKRGTMLFTVSELFSVYVVTSDGASRSFGSPGSTPGKFNIVGGVASDEDGRIYVTDVLRGTVSVFGRDFEFIGEFGHRGNHAGSLRSPQDLLVANNRVYVTQSIGGLKAFAIRIE